MQPAAPGLRGAVRHEEEMLDRDAAADAAIATLAAMFPHVPAPVLRRTLAIGGGSADGGRPYGATWRLQAGPAINFLGPSTLARATRRRFFHAVFSCYTARARTLSLYI